MSTHEPLVSQPLRTVDQLAADWEVSRWTIYRLVRDGELRAVRVGERLRFRAEDVDAYLDRSRGAAP